MLEVSLEALDLEVAKAVRARDTARENLARGTAPELDNPLLRHRRVSSRATFDDLGELAVHSPLAAAIRAWVGVLTLDRVLWPDEVRLGMAYRDPSVTMDDAATVHPAMSVAETKRRIVAEAEHARRVALSRALERGAEAVSHAAHVLECRRVDAARLLGVERFGLYNPLCSRDVAFCAAKKMLAVTAAFLPGVGSWTEAICLAVARDQSHGWPARLSPRWLHDLFRPMGLFEGLALDLAPLPKPVGASSFALALGTVGVALTRALAPTALGLSVVCEPSDHRGWRRWALFASLAQDPVFGTTVLKLSRDQARGQARAIATALLISLRLDAARVLLDGVLVDSDERSRASFEDRTTEALGVSIPPSLLGVVPKLGPSDAARIVGCLLAATERQALVNRFDEDWFRNPRAAAALREEDVGAPALRPIGESTLEEGIRSIVQTVTELG